MQHVKYASNSPSVLETLEGSNIPTLHCYQNYLGAYSLLRKFNVISLTANLNIGSCTIMLHYFMRPNAQNAIHASRKTGVERCCCLYFNGQEHSYFPQTVRYLLIISIFRVEY